MKQCTGCGEIKPLPDFSPHPRTSDGRQARCRKCKAHYAREQYKSPSERQAVRVRVQRIAEALRSAVFEHYGWPCACCGSHDAPTIDHVNGGGKAHREELFRGRGGHGSQFYRWLAKNGFPEGYQTLCNPCNSSKKETAHCNLDHGMVNAA